MSEVVSSQESWCDLARSKLRRVFAPDEAEALMQQTLASAGLDAIRSADELHQFGRQLATRGGFAAAVGALLALQAVLRGASRT